MPLPAGTHLGPYQVLSTLGAGGMGEVYRARDTRLDRDVAIKVLPESFAHDADRRARFEREAKAIAALSHPNILAIFDTGTHEGHLYVVTELLAGETLRERLSSTLPVRKSIEIAIQIARGLAAAHDKGLVHRDLKPENVFLTKDGQVKILDFGLARQMPTNTGATETIAAVTDPGTVMGTVGYMAPEQIRGLAIDGRTDLFAFGAVLYEMLAGRRAFAGATPADTMIAIVKEDPPELGAARADLPPAVDRIVRHCLEKNQHERFQTARDVAFALESLSGSGAATVATSSTPDLRKRPSRALLASAGAALLIVTAFALGRYWRPSTPEWVGHALGGPLVAYSPSISPKGDYLAFAAMVGIQTQPAQLNVSSGGWQELGRGTRGVAANFAWSASGDRLYFTRYTGYTSEVVWISMPGGEEQPLLQNAKLPQPLQDGSLLVARPTPTGRSQIHRFWPDGKRPEEPINAMLSKKAPSFRASPAGDAIVFWGSPAGNSSGGGQLYALKLDSGVVTRVAPQATIKERSWVFPLALSHDGAWVYFDHLSGDVHRIVRAPTDGSLGIEPLFTLTERPWGIDIGPDGSIYVDQFEQPAEVRWYSKPGTLRASVRVPGANCAALPIDRSRALVVLPYAGRDRLMVVDAEKPDKLLTPFIDTQEETTFPAVALGSDRFAFVAGSGPTRRLAIASTATSRLIGSIDGISPGISSLAATPDGTTVFYDNETDGYIWAKPVAGGEAVRVHEGNGVSMDPHGHYLIVKVDTDGRVRLFNVPWPLGTQVAREIATKTDLGLDQDWFGPRAVWRDGQITVRVGSNHSWYWPSAVLNPSTGTITVLDSAFDRDMCGPGWSYDGQIVTGAIGFQSTLWRFQQGR